MQKNIALLGSTGSIGVQTLEVVRTFPEQLNVCVLTCGRNISLLIQQALEFKPQIVVVEEEKDVSVVKEALNTLSVAVLHGQEGLTEAVQFPEIQVVLNAIVGSAGLRPTVKAIESGKDIALANKETLVVAGQLVMNLVKRHQVRMLPVDSEHSAIFQCLAGEEENPVEKIIITASGGPFRGKSKAELMRVTKEQALKHPNWVMGAKITIDSASLMNKGLEVIEAKWLFDLDINQVDVIVHPQSIIHSLVQFEDGSLKAQIGLPDMRLPIQYALSCPKRFKNDFPRFNFLDYPQFTFEKPDKETFRNLALAYETLHRGGNSSCVLNAANEVVVDAFLKDRVGFLEMSDIIESVLHKIEYIAHPTLEDYLASDQLARIKTKELITI